METEKVVMEVCDRVVENEVSHQMKKSIIRKYGERVGYTESDEN